MKYFILLFTVLLGCTELKTLEYPIDADTSSKPIQIQEKKVFTSVVRGQKVFLSNKFDGARLNDVRVLNDSTIAVHITPENTPINPSPWYAFKLWSDTSLSLCIRFSYPDSVRHRYFPKLKTKGQPKEQSWSKIDSANVLSFSRDSFMIRLNVSTDTSILSAQKLIPSEKVYAWSKNLSKKYADLVHYSVIGKTPLQRDIPVLDLYTGIKSKPVVVLITRQHPPEVTGYLAFQHFVERILEKNADLLSSYRILAFPIMNPDGVDLGNWRHNSKGVDLNRDWAYYRQSEIKQVVSYIIKEVERQNNELVLGLDFHSTYYDVFYTNEEDSTVSMPNFLSEWFKGLEGNIGGYAVNEKRSTSKKAVSKGWFFNYYNAVGVTYEMGDTTSMENIARVANTSADVMANFLKK